MFQRAAPLQLTCRGHIIRVNSDLRDAHLYCTTMERRSTRVPKEDEGEGSFVSPTIVVE